MKKPLLKPISIFIATALIMSLFAGMAVADSVAPTINGKTDLGWYTATISSNITTPYEITIVVSGSPDPTVDVTGTAGAYYKNGKVIVPIGLKASETPYTINIVAKNEAGQATMGVRLYVAEVPTINGYYKKSVTINLTEGYANPYAISCVVSGLPTPSTNIDTQVQGVLLDHGKLYIPGGLTAETSPYTVKVSATNEISGNSYTAETTFTINVYADEYDETGDVETPYIEGPDTIELVEGYESRPTYNYSITGTPYPIITATGLEGADYMDGKLMLPLNLNAETQNYLVILTASNDYGSNVKRVVIKVVAPESDGDDGDGDGNGDTDGNGDGDGDGDGSSDGDGDGSSDGDGDGSSDGDGDGSSDGDDNGSGDQTQGNGDPEPTATPTPTTSSGSSSSSTTIAINGISVSAKYKGDRLTMKPTEADIKSMFGDFEDTEYEFDLSAQDYSEVIWQMNPKWFSGIDSSASITFKQLAGNVTITGNMMLKLIEKAPSGVIDFVFRDSFVFVIEKGSNRAKWNDTDEPIYIQIPYSDEATDSTRIKSEQSGNSMPDAEDVEYTGGYLCGTVYNTGKYTVQEN